MRTSRITRSLGENGKEYEIIFKIQAFPGTKEMIYRSKINSTDYSALKDLLDVFGWSNGSA